MSEEQRITLNGQPATVPEVLHHLAAQVNDLTTYVNDIHQAMGLFAAFAKASFPAAHDALRAAAEQYPGNGLFVAMAAGSDPAASAKPAHMRLVVSNPVGHSRDNPPENSQQSTTDNNI
jgi:hypothetical protein